MFLPPRVKTLYPDLENFSTNEKVPIPLEYAYFLEDGEPDPIKINKYYFNYPGNWITSNNGEVIIGLRNIWLVAKRRKLEFSFFICKVLASDYLGLGGTRTKEDKFLTDEDYKTLDSNKKINLILLNVIDWLSTEGDLRGFFDAINTAIKNRIGNSSPVWKQSDVDPLDRDIQADGYHDKNGFHEKIFSPRNDKNNYLYNNYMIFFKIFYTNKDFDEVFNIGTGPNENDINNYKNSFCREFIFDNVWDRHSCKIYSSIGEQCNHHYIGNSNVNFNPIKYFKIQSTDQKFWIEIYSARNYLSPVKLSKGETFCIEMQFHPFDKALNI